MSPIQRLRGPVEAIAAKLPDWAERSLRQGLKRALRFAQKSVLNRDYARWVRDHDTLGEEDRRRILIHRERLAYKPLISVIMPVYETPAWALQEAIASVRAQFYPHWELCIADDASPSAHIADILSALCEVDSRIKWMRRERNGHISAASNSALTLASGEFVALMDHDDLLAPQALYEVAVALNENPSLDMIYSDEDQIDRAGTRHLPYFKSGWNSDLLLGHNFISHLGVFRRSLLASVGGFREGLEGSQDYDLALRCADATTPDKIHHIPAVLYHWRRDYGPSSFSEEQIATCSKAALRAIDDHLERRNESGRAVAHPQLPQWSRVLRDIPVPAPLVSLIVIAQGRVDLLGRCVEGLLRRTTYPNLEIIVVDHNAHGSETRRLLERVGQDTRLRFMLWTDAFNTAAMTNAAVATAKGEIVALINGDIDVIDAGWLKETVSHCLVEGVGAVGAMILDSDDRMQDAGLVTGVDGIVGHVNAGTPRSDVGYFGRNVLVTSVSAVTGACLVVRKSVFQEVGGFNERDLATVFSDVDFCFRLLERGYRNVWTPHATLRRAGTIRRSFHDVAGKCPHETAYMLKAWGAKLAFDPFYNPNFSADPNRWFNLARPRRRRRSWDLDAANDK